MRVENWESKLEQVIEKTKNKSEFKYGKNDCITFTLDCFKVFTGKKVFVKKGK